jgi:hypothetical protein
MAIIKPPFTRQTLEEEKRPDTFTVRVNKEEREELEKWKKGLNCPFDSKVMKILSRVGWNVLHGDLGEEGMRYLFSLERRKLEE